MNNTFLERIGIDPIILFIILFILILVLFYLNRRAASRYNQLKTQVRHMNKAMRNLGVPVKPMAPDFEKAEKKQGLSDNKAEKLLQEVRGLRANFADNYQKTGIVKYDAFDEMGGKLSFVLVMLDGRDNGVMLNVMHSRSDCYTYIKEISRGTSYVELSAEEQLALEKAMHQDEVFEEDLEGVPTGRSGNLKRAYTLAQRRQEEERKAKAREEALRKQKEKKEKAALAAAAKAAEKEAKREAKRRAAQEKALQMNEEEFEEAELVDEDGFAVAELEEEAFAEEALTEAAATESAKVEVAPIEEATARPEPVEDAAIPPEAVEAAQTELVPERPLKKPGFTETVDTVIEEIEAEKPAFRQADRAEDLSEKSDSAEELLEADVPAQDDGVEESLFEEGSIEDEILKAIKAELAGSEN